PDQQQTERGNLVGREGEVDEAQPLEYEPEQERAESDSGVACKTAEDEDREADERKVGRERLRVDERDVERQQVAGDRAERGGRRERLELVGVDVLSQRRDGVPILADRSQHAAPRGVLEDAQDRKEDEEREPGEEEERQVVLL